MDEEHAMGEVQDNVFEPEFNRSIKVELADDRITSDAGVILLREADGKLGLTESLCERLFDPRDPCRIRYSFAELVRARLYALALGYDAQDDLDRLAHDPAFQMAVWDRPGEAVLGERLASQPTQSRLIDMLAHIPGNLQALRESLLDWTHRHVRSTRTGGDHAVMRATIDVDSFPIVVHGEQQGSSYNKHYGDVVYHPMVASFSVDGDYDSALSGKRLGNGFIHAVLRQGQVHTSKGCLRFMRNVVEGARAMARTFDLRLDAGYVFGAVTDFLTDEQVSFCGRIRVNSVLDEMAAPHIYRPSGRPPAQGYEYVVELGTYQAQDWKHAQRVILVVVDKPDPKTGQLNLIPHHFFLLTNWTQQQRSAMEVLFHYRQRGTFEDRLGEFQGVIGPHLSSRDFAENEATLLLSLLAFNLTSMLRNELEYELGSNWDLGRFQTTVLKTGGRVVKHARRLVMRVAQSAGPLWSRLVACIQAFRLPKRWRSPRGPRRRAWTPPPQHAHLCEVLRL
jgi:hypothetical protein